MLTQKSDQGTDISPVSDITVPRKGQSVNNYSMQDGVKNTLENKKQFIISNVDNEISNGYNPYGKTNRYKQGTVIDKISIDDYGKDEYIYDTVRDESSIDWENETNGDRQENNLLGNMLSENHGTNSYDDELDNFIEEHPEFFTNKRESYRDFRKRINQEDKASEQGALSISENDASENIQEYSVPDENDESFNGITALSAVSKGGKPLVVQGRDFKGKPIERVSL